MIAPLAKSPETPHECIETENIVAQLLLQENISIVYNDRNDINKIQRLSLV